MPVFYFHTDDATDATGTNLKNVDVARCEAVTRAGRILCDDPEGFWNQGGWTMTVTDEHGLILFQLCIVGTDAPTSVSARRLPFVSPPA
jgi:hypothetical protein